MSFNLLHTSKASLQVISSLSIWSILFIFSAVKGRNGLKDLREAIENVKEGKEFVSPSLKPGLNGSTDFEIEEYDIFLLKHLSYGLSQNQISDLFISKKIAPSSISSIEKRLNRLKDILKANNNVQLVANAKDLGII